MEPLLDSYEINNDIQLPKHIIKHIQDDSNRPGPSGLNNLKSVQSENSFSNKNKMVNIPKLSFGLDLKYWGQKIEPAERVKNNFDGHQFWCATDSEYIFLIYF